MTEDSIIFSTADPFDGIKMRLPNKGMTVTLSHDAPEGWRYAIWDDHLIVSISYDEIKTHLIPALGTLLDEKIKEMKKAIIEKLLEVLL